MSGQKPPPGADLTRGAPHYELLIRLLDEEGKLVPPLAFIPAAERYNLMTSIDRWVVNKAFETFSANAELVSGWQFSINLSGQSLSDEGFLKYVIDAFERTGVSPEQVCFEITETTAISNLETASQFISEIRDLGFLFALDDFGVGMSSFAYLKAIPVDVLKIDGGFVRNILNDPMDQAIVEACNNIAHSAGLITVAEFVENKAIEERLRELGVDFGQGYGIEKPRPLDA